MTTNGDALATELRRLAMETPENRFCVRVTVREAAILRALIRWAEGDREPADSVFPCTAPDDFCGEPAPRSPSTRRPDDA